jgi:hypothetical protein
MSRTARIAFRLVAGVTVGLVAASPAEATPSKSATAASGQWTYRPLGWAAQAGGQGGPVLSPDIVPLYWGKNANDWVVGGNTADDDPNLINAWIDGFANYVSGVGAPAGYEPVTKQYGVWGAERYGGTFTCNGSCSSGDTVVADTGIQQRIQKLQGSGVLPPTTANRIFVVFLKGFTYSGMTGACGYHSLSSSSGPYYIVVPYELAASAPEGSTSNCTFQGVLSHELFETMTDPYPSNGWTTSSGLEGGDTCVPYDTVDGPGSGSNGIAQFPWGFIQTFGDNVTGSCSPWSWQSSPTITASNWPQNNEMVNAFITTPNLPGGLLHVATADGVNWGWEQAGPTVSASGLVQAPAVVKPAGNRIDAFVRGAGGPTGRGVSSYLYHFSKTVGGSWTMAQMADSTVAQPSAVSTTTNRIDMVARSWDSSVVHYWSNDNTNFLNEDFSSQTLGPPVITSPGFYNFDVYTYGMHADQVINSYTNGGSWSGFRTLEAGINGMLPVLIGAAAIGSPDRIVFGAYSGGYDSTQTEHETYLPRYTVDNNSWTQTYYSLGNATPFGATAVIANANGVDVSWYDRSSFGYYYWHFNATTHSWGQIENTANWDPVMNLGPYYITTPAMTYGSDGAVYVLGIGGDDSLYVTRISGGSAVGPTFTGLTGIL